MVNESIQNIYVKQGSVWKSMGTPGGVQSDWKQTDASQLDYIKNKEDFINKVNTIESDVNNLETVVRVIETDVETIEGKVTTLETKVETVETRVDTVETKVETVEKEVEVIVKGVTVKDTVATKADLDNYPTSGLNVGDVIGVLRDETHDNKYTYWRWNGTAFEFFSQKPDVYSKEEALDTFVAKEEGKGLSTNDYTTDEKNKLAGISPGAEVNVQSDWSITDDTSDAFIKNKPGPATDSTLGMIKVGQNLSITEDGTLSAEGGSLTQVQSDWSQTDDTKVDFIKNKPNLDGFVPSTRTINSKALSSNITLTYTDVGAAAAGASLGSFAQNASYRTCSDIEKATWNGKQNRVLSGTTDPTQYQGNDGDLYVKYSE